MSSFVEIFYAFLVTFCTAIFLAGNYTTSSPQRLNIGARWLWRAAHSVVVMLKCKDVVIGTNFDRSLSERTWPVGKGGLV
jgi:hypothetical protein